MIACPEISPNIVTSGKYHDWYECSQRRFEAQKGDFLPIIYKKFNLSQ
jgi:hypothetical protein